MVHAVWDTGTPCSRSGLTPNPFCIDIVWMQCHAQMLGFSQTGEKGEALAAAEGGVGLHQATM